MSSYTKFKDTNVKSNRNMDCHRAYEAEECLKLSKINLFKSEIRNVCCLFFGRNYTSCPKLASSTSQNRLKNFLVNKLHKVSIILENQLPSTYRIKMRPCWHSPALTRTAPFLSSFIFLLKQF